MVNNESQWLKKNFVKNFKATKSPQKRFFNKLAKGFPVFSTPGKKVFNATGNTRRLAELQRLRTA